MIPNRPIMGLAALIGLLTAFPAAAQAMRTEVLNVGPPKDWVLSVWQGGTIELGEFTPVGQTGGRYVDLLGYSAIPRDATRFNEADDLRKFEREEAVKDCRFAQYVERPAAEGWVSLARICVGRDGAAADTAELEFATTTLTDQAVYRVWRTYRAPFAEVMAATDAAGASADALDPALFARIVETWAPRLEPDLERRGVCDLERLTGCDAVPDRLPDEAERRFEGKDYVIGVWLDGENRITRERFLEVFQTTDDGTPNQVIAVLEDQEIDWSDAEAISRLLTMIAYGQAADGAVLGVTDSDASLAPAERALVRARIIQNLRRLVRPGVPLPEVVVAIPRP